MSAPALKSKSEQKLEWLESLGRPLSDEESVELRRCLHAVYCRNWRLERERKALKQHKAEERALLAKVFAESKTLELLPEGGR